MLAPPVALILSNGLLDDPPMVRRRLERTQIDMIVAADGGARHAATLGLRPTVIVGDLDSLEPGELARAESGGASLLRRPPDKDETDLELALVHAFELGAASAIVVGAAGGRLDMTLANVMLLLHPALRGRSVELWAGRQTAFLITPPGGEIQGSADDRVSLVPLGGEAVGVSTHGLAFPLRKETLPLGPARGVSNRIRQAPARVDLTSGTLLVVHTPAGSDE